ncbi:MAG: tRNA (5-methylaminomethyl-2-thiouridylate)-methyltransferase, partial [Candidatus Syntrophosphaera sp.]
MDSILAVVWMRELGYEVHPVFFSAPYIFAERAVRSAAENGLKLTVVDISQKHLEMLSDPVYGYGRNVNPCIDCHALMFREAGGLLDQFKADFLISGEVLGQRPMSQRRNALQAVDKHSGCGDLIVRPLSQKLLSDTKPIRDEWVDKDLLLAIHGRGRKRQ